MHIQIKSFVYSTLHVLHSILVVPEAVTDFMVETTERSALLLASPPDVTNGIVIYYLISYQLVGSVNVTMMNFTTTDMSLNTTLMSLLPFTNYTFSVRPCTIAGCGPASNNITSTLEDG